ncbi:sugar ABC transporter substrate-binding protein [Haloarcula nitratireducens]|uniref:Substrate-binding domain-containing protein n=1 Tax=Haloarcula nitratireducens TaxID=2487749 RepID=A0AAW4PGH6_9EURY|nr:sugar ABC transporter substrate-binding protein [Halomicroarcula nitratireducens]MBX0297016.1 substrate-binding domain-containing protein [Halomicroarcula nitratireducens]
MRVSRRNLLRGIGAASCFGAAGCLESSGDSDGGSTSNGDGGASTGTASGGSGSNGYHFGISMKGMGQAGLFVQGLAGKWYTQDTPHKVTITDAQFEASKQTEQAINLLNQDVDGILLNPSSGEASAKIAQRAAEEDVPVMNFDTATLSNEVILGNMFGQRRGGKVAAERFVKLLEERTGSKEAKVITSVFTFSAPTSQQRLYGFTENLPDSVEVVSRVESNGTAEETTPKMVNALRANPEVNAIYSNNVGSGMGALQALQQLDRYKKKGKEGHVMAFGIDGGPTLNQRIEAGYYDFAVDQPLHFYAPMTIELMIDYIEGGKEALPQVGSTVKPGEDLTVENKEVFGVKPWSKNFWGPAPMTEFTSNDKTWFPWLKARHAMITEDNAMEPYLYGNIARRYQEQQ